MPIYTWDTTNNQNVARTLSLDPSITPSSLAVATPASSNGTANALASLFDSGNAADWELLAQLQYGAHDCKGALESVEKASPAGKEASESVLKLRYTCYTQDKDGAKAVATAEELLRRFPKKEWYQAVLADLQPKKPDDLAMLGVLRYGG